MDFYGTEEEEGSDYSFDQFIFSFGLFMGFVDEMENTVCHQF